MILFKKIADIQKYLEHPQQKSKKVGFVPTMGALHRGHASLMQLSMKENDITVASIFVNPLQFNDKRDYVKYPITIEKDVLILSELEIDILFLPDEKEIYPDTSSTMKTYELGRLDTILEASSRPGHFQGVARVMDILLHIVKPDTLYLGQKDFQQIRVIRKLIASEKLQIDVIEAPLIREESGLAMSSRNARLDETGRATASLLFQNLHFIQQHADDRTFETLKNTAIENLERAGFTIDYIVLANSDTLDTLKDFEKGSPMILLAAVFFQDVRLIDNIRL